MIPGGALVIPSGALVIPGGALDRPPVRPSDRPTVRPYIQNSHIYEYGHNCIQKWVPRHDSGGIRKEI